MDIDRDSMDKSAGNILSPSTGQGVVSDHPSVWRELGLLLLKILAIAGALVILFTFFFGLVRYTESSMAPAIKDGDLVVFYRYKSSGYLAKDVVVLDFQGQRQVRRVVATQGDVVDISDRGLLINGALQQELEIIQETERYQEGVDFPLTVPQDHVFVLADLRTDAIDSRVYGCVEIEDTLGKVMMVIRRRSI
jgi:signal peptidase I